MKRFLIIDDDEQNNSLSRIVLKRALGEVQVVTFVYAQEGLDYIRKQFLILPEQEKITIFLDINMTAMSGWQFLEKFKDFKDAVKKQYNIYMLSSSVDPAEIERAKSNPYVLDFIEKPLSKQVLLQLFEQQLIQ